MLSEVCALRWEAVHGSGGRVVSDALSMTSEYIAKATEIVGSLGDERMFVAVAEMDRFAALRERMGYTTSNALIEEAASRIRTSLSGGHIGRIGRIGRTTVEFAFAAASVEDAQKALLQLVHRVEQPFLIHDVEFDLTVTVGAVDAGCGEINDRQLDAAAASLRSAQEHHQKIHIGQADTLQTERRNDLSLVRDLRRAVQQDALELYYQPKLRSRTDTVDSAEGLLRWFHPVHGLVPTDKLIELAEATGAVRDLTFWVIERALADQSALAALGHSLTIFVNISGILLPDRAFADWALARIGCGNGRIGFEITETAVIEEPTLAIHNLHRFAAAGIKIAIDDYGSGLSSLAYLKQLPAHELKIDRMFVKGLTETQRDPLLVRSSIDLAHALEMEVTAEGVDNPMSLSLLRVMGCDMVQGYLISPPLRLPELKGFLQESRHVETLANSASTVAAWNGDVPAAI
jgi:EAL domain-containing protein (putative c-di-GMP-specific phosphodiesterase class I)/GGDEF domain-containing protein